jgi:hypothetical protein
MRFLGRKWEKKNNGNGKGNKFSRFAFGFAPAFGRAVGPSAWPFLACLKACPSGGSSAFFGMPEGMPFRSVLCVWGMPEQRKGIFQQPLRLLCAVIFAGRAFPNRYKSH